MSNVSRAKSFGSGFVILFIRRCNSSHSSAMSGQFEPGITTALLHRSTEISSSGFGFGDPRRLQQFRRVTAVAVVYSGSGFTEAATRSRKIELQECR
jgi:hypothetical protein